MAYNLSYQYYSMIDYKSMKLVLYFSLYEKIKKANADVSMNKVCFQILLFRAGLFEYVKDS